MAHIFDYTTYILKKDRTEEEFNRIYNWLRRKSDILKSLNYDAFKILLDKSEVFRCMPNQLIIRQGEIGDCFYILLTGSASIFINTDLPMDDNFKSNSFIKSNKQKDFNFKYLSESDRKTLGQYVGTYKDGSCFGEMALIQRESIRNASIIIDEKSTLLYISRQLFDDVIKSYAEEIYKAKLVFVNQIFLFKSWQPRMKQQISMSFEKKSFCFGEKIIVQGETTNGMLFFIKGSAKLIFDFKRSATEISLAESLLKEKTKNQSTELNISDNKEIKSSRLREIFEKSGSSFNEDYEVALIGEKEYVGDIEYITNYPTNLFSCIACEDCECYILNNLNLSRIFKWKKPSKSTDSLSEIGHLKLNYFYNRCTQINEAPVLKIISEIMLNLLITKEQSNLSNANINNSQNERQKKSSKLEFKQGPIIDMYGPGSVFYCTKMKRENKKNNKLEIGPRKTRSILLNEQLMKQWESTNNESILTPDPSIVEKSTDDWYIKRIEKDIGSANLCRLETKLERWMSNIEISDRNPKFKEYEIVKFPRIRRKIEQTFNSSKKNDEDGEEVQNTMKGIAKKQYTALDFKNMKKDMLSKERKLEYLKMSLQI